MVIANEAFCQCSAMDWRPLTTTHLFLLRNFLAGVMTYDLGDTTLHPWPQHYVLVPSHCILINLTQTSQLSVGITTLHPLARLLYILTTHHTTDTHNVLKLT